MSEKQQIFKLTMDLPIWTASAST